MSSFFTTDPAPDVVMTYFYGHLFAIAPGIRGLFPASMHAQRQRFYDALRTLAPSGAEEEKGGAGEGSPDEDDEQALSALGRAHRKFGVKPEHYVPFREALLATARHFAGSEADAARAEAALAAAFDRAAAIMIAALADPATDPAWWTAEVTRHESPAPDIAVLTVRPDAPLRYLSGQHLPVQTPRWPRQWRSYFIVNAPRPDGTLTLRVKAVPGGLVSTALVYHTRPGDILLLGAPDGPQPGGPQPGGPQPS
jgi:hemoglobin-like flavoprotein